MPQLGALFHTIGMSADRETVAGAINMTAVFAYQALLKLSQNIDTGGHNFCELLIFRSARAYVVPSCSIRLCAVA